ncbi:MAG: hypothetical protein LUC86_05225 [Prevotellaceae bacterium]|nr:hypothetical protein [Prevotellaceae bacterium]MCD8304209.1 hypothetical protein [Prevotellaceae bacterium]
MKLEKLSNYVLYAISAIIVLSFLAFFLIGYDNPEGDKNAPMLTGYLLWLQYALGIIACVLMIWSVVVSARKSSGSDEVKMTGIPGSKIVLVTCAITIVSMIVGLLLGLGEDDFTTSSGSFTPGYMVTLVDVFMWAMYILAVVSVIAVVISATGIFVQKKK